MSTVARSLIEHLRAAGTQALFGLPGGGGNLDLIETAGRLGLPFVLTATETGSAIAAIAQAEITGAPGACITTLGPGAASVANGVACAKLERAPLLVITDSHATGATFEHQRFDHVALLAAVTKWSARLAPDAAAQRISDAFDTLAELPPGPVHLDCPAEFERTPVSAPAASVAGVPDVAGHLEISSRRASDRRTIGGMTPADYGNFRTPLLILGLGSRRHGFAAAIRELCETSRVPALVTYKAKGVVPDSHPWFGGVFTHGVIERPIIDACDLIIGIGFDPVEILPRPWSYRQPVISIAPWEMPADHVPFRHQDVGVDPAAIRELGGLLRSEWNQEVVQAHADRARRTVFLAGSKDPASSPDDPAFGPTDPASRVSPIGSEAGPSGPAGLTAQSVVSIAAARFAGRARVTVDAGAHMFPATVLWPVSEPNEMLISNGLSTMGFALPAAIGASLLDRERPVVALTGDGGLLICMGELATLARERLRVIVIVFNDSSLSLIEIKQQARGLAADGVALGDLRWARIAEGFGIPAWTARTAPELERALESAGTANGPALVDVKIDRSNYGDVLKAIRG